MFRFVLLWFALNIFALTLAQFYTWNYTKGKTRRREKQFKNYIFFPFCRCNRSGTPIAVCSHYDGDVYVCLCFISLIFFHIFWKAKAKYAGVQLFVTIIIMIKKYFGYGVCIIHIQATYIELIFEAPFNAHEHIYCLCFHRLFQFHICLVHLLFGKKKNLFFYYSIEITNKTSFYFIFHWAYRNSHRVLLVTFSIFFFGQNQKELNK